MSAGITLHQLALSRVHGINIATARNFLARLHGDEERFFALTPRQLALSMGFDSRIFADEPRRKALEEARRELRFIEGNGISARYFADPASGYPSRLAECDDAPAVIYTLGNCDLDKARMVGIVGTRHATAYGTDFTSKMVADLAASVGGEEVVIVSGLAYGIDIAAHKAAIECGLPTVGVLAHGLNTIYPAAHRNIAADMVQQGGALVTEYASGNAVHRGNFLARNRIVAGLCDCIVVVESDIKGGALVTARLAADYNREVLAAPGRATDRFSRGCNSLISRNMARILPDPAALPDIMGWPRRSREGIQQELFAELDPTEQKIIEALSTSGADMRLADLQMLLNEQTHRLMGLLIDMELRGLISALPGNRYRLA